MTLMELVSGRTSVTIALKMGTYPYTAPEKLAADQGHHVLQYYINIIAITQQLLDMEDLFGTPAK